MRHTILLAALCLGTVNVFGLPIVDGFFDLSEGYTSGNYLNFSYESGGYLSEQGQLWTRQDSSTYDVYAAVVLPRSVVDNSYGENSIGWQERGKGITRGRARVGGRGNGKSNGNGGYGHTFEDLLRSDKARFKISNSQGTVVDFDFDYIAVDDQAASGYSSTGAGQPGRHPQSDGKIHAGNKNALAEWGTSLDYNLNTLGYVLTEDSPSADDDYTNIDPQYADWVFDAVYEFKIDGEALGEMGFNIDNIETHISPMKTGGLSSNAEIGENISTVPEPATIMLLGLSALYLRFKQRKNLA